MVERQGRAIQIKRVEVWRLQMQSRDHSMQAAVQEGSQGERQSHRVERTLNFGRVCSLVIKII